MLQTSTELLTIADLEALPDDGRRHELIGGTIVVSPFPVPRHQTASRNLQRLLEAACPADHVVFNAPIGLTFGPNDLLGPDLVVTPRSSIGEEFLGLPTLLVVELVSPGSTTLDRVTKRAAYAAAGVPHYWLVDTRPRHARFTALRLVDGEYETVLDTSDVVEVDEPLAVAFDVVDLFID